MSTAGIEPTGIIFSLATFIPGLSVTWRRLHDTNRSGWWYGGGIIAVGLLGLVAGALIFSTILNEQATDLFSFMAIIAGAVALVWIFTIFIFTIQDSVYGENKYGPNPKGEGNASVFD